MFRFLTIITAICGLSLNLIHPDSSKSLGIPIVFTQTTTPLGPIKNLGSAPVDGMYHPSTCIVEIWFTYDMGEVSIEVKNTTTGVSYNSVFDTQYLNTWIITSGSQGHYTVTVSLSSGIQYLGEYDVI